MPQTLALFESLVADLDAGRPCALCAVVNTRGSTPQIAGAMLLVHASGQTEGTIGGGCIEAEVRRRALKAIFSGDATLISFDSGQDSVWDDVFICGGRLDVAVVPFAEAAQAESLRQAIQRMRRQERVRLPLRVEHEGKPLEYRLNLAATPTLLVVGAGHVGRALAMLSKDLDFRVVVFDDRNDLLSPLRLPAPIETAPGDMESRLRQWPVDGNTYVVIVTRGHRHDEETLHAVIDSPARYLGMIGSRRKSQVLFENLEAAGVSRAKLERVHTPIGLMIGAVTPAELAVSIAAELVQVRRAETCQAVEGPLEPNHLSS